MRLETVLLTLALGLSALGCTQPEAPQYLYGNNLALIQLDITSIDMGIHPDTSVLDNESNPFRHSALGDQTKWELNDQPNPVAAYYSWATQLAYQPTGEHQFYTALKLKAIFEEGAADPILLPVVRDMAIAAFQSVLDNFPGSVTFDATGTVPFSLPPLAYGEIINMGGTVENGWVLIETVNGSTEVVRRDGNP